ncbi:hypothetical protein PMAYCL1PPCAC_02089 [Pristionchus mayeri]|uniref:Uncharacterized protein n=1 Tax=Pristionchus mayeri TaxID=1317129 RepID=A0AAN5C7L7_9BILA|nr:hypothetical protein PMAYCL1PPCAC_02089 [Pristionchus mayeri]
MPYIYVPPPDYDSHEMPSGFKVSRPFEPAPDYPVTIRLSREALQALRMDTRFNKPSPQIVEEEEEEEDELPRLPIRKRKEQLQEETPRLVNPRTRKHIRMVGVPVLPPIPVTDFEGKGVSLEENRAFLRHLANHRNFDTMKSLRTCDDCPICRIVIKEHFEARESDEPPSPPPLHHHHNSSSDNSTPPRGKHRPDVRDLFAPL